MDPEGRVSIALAEEADEYPHFPFLSPPGLRLDSFLEVLFHNFASLKTCASMVLLGFKPIHRSLLASGSSSTLASNPQPHLHLSSAGIIGMCHYAQPQALWDLYPPVSMASPTPYPTLHGCILQFPLSLGPCPTLAGTYCPLL